MKRIVVDVLVMIIVLSGMTLAAQAASGESRDFSITGYYSPLPGQSFYVTGSYEGDIRLNGHGVAGADGTPVFPGMIAAPPDYAFGTKICLPNFGCGSVHDRGGAIVNAGGRNIARHDRLDLWLGYGEEGLLRALQWGLVHTSGKIYSADAPVDVVVNFAAVAPLARMIDLPDRQVFAQNLALGDEGGDVRVLQSALKTLGYYYGAIDSQFDEVVETAVRNFQLDHFVILSATDNGNGRFGPSTREKLSEMLLKVETEELIEKKWSEFHFEGNAARGSRNDEVWKLQELLIQGEYLDHAPTGYFGKLTKAALVEFQIDQGLIAHQNSAGAGNVGPKTTERLNQLLVESDQIKDVQQERLYVLQKKQNRLRQIAGKSVEIPIAQK